MQNEKSEAHLKCIDSRKTKTKRDTTVKGFGISIIEFRRDQTKTPKPAVVAGFA
jgi:hypothetical protein